MTMPMRGNKRSQESAVFQTDRRGRLKYSREDWTGVDLPREPSLRLGEDEYFFERVIDVNSIEERHEKQDRFLEFVSTTGIEAVLSEKYQSHVLSQKNSKASKKKKKKKRRKPVPISVRRIEIELTQRRLPRRPSYKDLAKPTFYPLESFDLFDWPPEEPETEKEVSVTTELKSKHLEDEDDPSFRETSGKKRVAFSQLVDEEKSTSTTEIGTECLETESEMYGSARELQVEIVDEDNTSAAYIDEDEYDEDDQSYYDESYYSESEVLSEDEVSMEAENIFEEFLEMQRIHLQNVAKEEAELDPEVEEIVEEYYKSLSTIDDISDEDSTNHTTEAPPIKRKQSTAIGFVTKFLPETPYESEDGIYLREVGFVSPLVRMMIFQARMELRCRTVTEEHKEEYQPTLAEAILLARQTKLDEHVIETEGKNKVKHDDAVIPSVVWVRGKETVKLPNFKGQTPEQFLIFKEAVALGGIKALKPEITTNYDPLTSIKNSYNHDIVDVDDVNKHKVIRTKYLTDMYLEEWRAQSDDEDEESVKFDSLDDVELPTKDCPEYKCVEAKLEGQELKDLIAQQVAEAVWERRYRLERPRAKQRIKYRCTCKYCKTSSTYQTFAYRKRWLIQKNLWCEPTVRDTTQEITEVPLVDDQNEESEEKKILFRTKGTADLSFEDLSRNLSQDFSAETGSYSEDYGIPDGVSVSISSSECEPTENDTPYAVVPALSMRKGQKEEKDEKKKSFMNRSSMRGIRSLFQ